MHEQDQRNRESWEKEILKNVMLYPSDNVVSFLGRNFKNREENGEKHALDVGFGSGRHLKLLLDYGFRTYGIDYSDECLQTATKVLGVHPNLKELKTDDLADVEFDIYFDAVVCWGVIFLRTADRMLDDLKHIARMMKSGAKLCINFRSREDFLFGQGKKVNEQSYVLGKETGPYENMLYTFLNKDEAEKLLADAGFIVENTEKLEYWKNNLQEKHSWWIFSARKG